MRMKREWYGARSGSLALLARNLLPLPAFHVCNVSCIESHVTFVQSINFIYLPHD